MSTGTSRTVSAPVFHGDDPEQTTEYSSLSVLAIISLIMGIAAPLAIAAPFLMAIPLFGIAVALVALRRISVSGGALAGQWPARIGLALCVASALVPVSHDMIQRTMRVNDAEKFGQKWIETVASGNLKEAFRLTIDGNKPIPAADSMGVPNRGPKVSPYESFTAQPVIQAIQAIGLNPVIRVRDTIDFQAKSARNISVNQSYSVASGATATNPSGQPLELLLTIQRATLPRESQSRWLIGNVTYPKSDADSSAKK